MDVFDKCFEYRDPDLVKAAGIYPFFHPLEGSEGPVVTVDGHPVIMLGSNNYLGLTHHPDVVKAAHQAIDRYGTGCTGSRFLNGNLDLHERLEAELATFLNKRGALVFSSGFLANLGVLGLLAGSPEVAIFANEENHASLIDGARMSRCRTIRFFKNPAHLAKLLASRSSWPNALVVTDGVFSMTGRVVDLPGIIELRRRYGFRIYVDDAHGIGVLGREGRGTVDFFGLTNEVDLIFGTFSKAFASVGGFVAGDERVIHYLRHQTRTLIFSAALPPSSAASALEALHVMQREPKLFERLHENTTFFREGVEAIGFRTLGSTTPIVPLFVGSETHAFQISREALDMGLFVTPAVYPAVPPGHALIRTSLTPAHTKVHLTKALEILKALSLKHPIPDRDPATLPHARAIDLEERLMPKRDGELLGA